MSAIVAQTPLNGKQTNIPTYQARVTNGIWDFRRMITGFELEKNEQIGKEIMIPGLMIDNIIPMSSDSYELSDEEQWKADMIAILRTNPDQQQITDHCQKWSFLAHDAEMADELPYFDGDYDDQEWVDTQINSQINF